MGVILQKKNPAILEIRTEIFHLEAFFGGNSLPGKARKIQLNIWSSEDDQDTKSGRPQACEVVLRCILFAGH